MPSRHAAFTLLEICLTLFIGMVLLLMAVPSVAGLLSEQRLHESFIRFEQFANTARWRSMKEQQPFRLVWEKRRIVLEGASHSKGESEELDVLPLADDESYQLARAAALINPAPEEWTFWPDGTCEPVTVSYRGRHGRWQVRFDALNPHGTFQQSEPM
jgi:Tfp pilus assembly protein FimT